MVSIYCTSKKKQFTPKLIYKQVKPRNSNIKVCLNKDLDLTLNDGFLTIRIYKVNYFLYESPVMSE